MLLRLGTFAKVTDGRPSLRFARDGWVRIVSTHESGQRTGVVW